VTVNLVYYEQNYLSIYLFFLFMMSLLVPSFVASSLALVISAILVEHAYIPLLESHYAKTSTYQRIVIPVGKKQIVLTINPTFVRRLFGIGASLILLFTGGLTLIRSMAFATLIVLLHSVFRKRSIGSRTSTFMTEHFRHSLLSSFINSIPQIGDEDEEELATKDDPISAKRHSVPADPHRKYSKAMLHDEDNSETSQTSTPSSSTPPTPTAAAHGS